MGALGDVARDFVEVRLHHVGVGVGQREGRQTLCEPKDKRRDIAPRP